MPEFRPHEIVERLKQEVAGCRLLSNYVRPALRLSDEKQRADKDKGKKSRGLSLVFLPCRNDRSHGEL